MPYLFKYFLVVFVYSQFNIVIYFMYLVCGAKDWTQLHMANAQLMSYIPTSYIIGLKKKCWKQEKKKKLLLKYLCPCVESCELQ